MVLKEILRVIAIPRDALLDKVNNQEKKNKKTFIITFHTVFRNERKTLEELHVTVASDCELKVFPDVRIIGFKINKNLTAHLVSLQLPDLDDVGRSKPFRGKIISCHLCNYKKDKCTFKSNHLDGIHTINKKYNCNSKMAVYLTECQICGEK